MPQSPLHRACRVRISRHLRSALRSPRDVVEECPIHIAFDGEPIPDVVVLRGLESDYDQRHPTPDDVILLVEIAVSSVEYDLGEKALLYAQASIGDYWVVLPERRQVLVHREPMPDGYGSIVVIGEQETVSPLAASEIVLSVREMLGAPG